ncbi:zinc finger CW-type PWWP domain protein 2-like [Amia ocellicauda]|uniref:zinc finger CW-type PWWP domain protein 2-like n=1 Tax=Amia ocellicauda TaxID=2972642 RepID=UPI0034648B76
MRKRTFPRFVAKYLFSCLVPEEWFPNHTDLYGHGMKFVYSPLPAGSLVMIKASKWPWWPAILCPDPLSGSYVTYDTDGHIDRYHAEFLGNPHSRIWASARIVSPYPIPAAKPKNLKGLMESYECALEEAMKLQPLKCEDRLEMCHFKVLENCWSAQSTCELEDKKSETASQCHLIDEETFKERGDFLLIEGIRFKTGISLEEIMD